MLSFIANPQKKTSNRSLLGENFAIVDAFIQKVMDELKALGIAENTLLVAMADNGPMVYNPPPGLGMTETIFTGGKGDHTEGGVRVPAFVIWKDHIKEGIRLDFPSITSDYLPTILDILNIKYPDSRPIDGVSLHGLLQGKNEIRENAIGFILDQKISWVDNQYKLISVDNGENFELYNLINDRSEKENIIQKEPEIATKMKNELFNWLRSVENSKKGMDYK